MIVTKKLSEMMKMHWSSINWVSCNFRAIDMVAIDWSGIDYQTFFSILNCAVSENNDIIVEKLLAGNASSLSVFAEEHKAWITENAEEQKAWITENAKNTQVPDHAKMLKSVERYLSRAN